VLVPGCPTQPVNDPSPPHITPLLMTAVAPKMETVSWRLPRAAASSTRAARVGAGAATGCGAGRGFGDERTRVMGSRRKAERRMLFIFSGSGE
jgi:hypothetical protein